MGPIKVVSETLKKGPFTMNAKNQQQENPQANKSNARILFENGFCLSLTKSHIPKIACEKPKSIKTEKQDSITDGINKMDFQKVIIQR